MKKFMFIGAAALAMFAATGFTAPVGYPAESMYLTTTSNVDAEYTTCKFNCNYFSGLELSGIVEVNLVKSDSYKVEITLPNVLQEYLQVYVNHGILKIGWNKNIPANLQKKLGNWTCKAEIAMPELRKLDMSGITSLKCDDTFDLGNEELSLDISGASKIKSLSVNARKLDAEISGVCTCKLSGNFSEKAELDLSGTSKTSFQINADKLEVDISGATKTNIDGKFGKVELDASGTSEVNLNGKVGTLEVDASGVSKVKAMDAETENAILETSGTANCSVNVTRSIMIEDATGVSSINYKAPMDLGVMIKSIGRSASVQRVN